MVAVESEDAWCGPDGMSAGGSGFGAEASLEDGSPNPDVLVSLGA